MSISNQILNQVKQICRAYDIRPSRSKGQNFLINEKIIEQIVEAASISNDDFILEVGPGLGILTEKLVKCAKQVVSVELDKKLFAVLKAKFAGVNNLELINDDILNFNPTSYKLPASSYQLVANIPYNITSHFLKKFLTIDSRPQTMTLLIQKEVAKRICAQTGAMSLLALSVQLYSQPEIIQMVSRNNFWPTPAVDSAILKLSDIRNQKSVDKFFSDHLPEKFFWQIARIGFAAKRKQLQNNLASGLKISSTQAKKLLNQANFDEKIRAQELAVADWLKLTGIIYQQLKK